jgi:hypothetical protein
MKNNSSEVFAYGAMLGIIFIIGILALIKWCG